MRQKNSALSGISPHLRETAQKRKKLERTQSTTEKNKAGMPDKCTICLDDECALFVLCEHDHAVCKECLRRVVRNFVSEPKSDGVQCGAGPSAPCRGVAKPALLFHALAHTGEDHTAEVNMLLKTLGSVESASAAEKAERETEQRMLDRSEEAKTVQRLVQYVQVRRSECDTNLPGIGIQ